MRMIKAAYYNFYSSLTRLNHQQDRRLWNSTVRNRNGDSYASNYFNSNE